MPLIKLNTQSATSLDATKLTGNLPAISGASLTGVSAGKVLQVVGATNTTQTSSTANSYSDTGLTASITPSSSSNKVLIIVQQSIGKTAANTWSDVKLQRGSTDLGNVKSVCYTATSSPALYLGSAIGYTYLDSPSSTSATTYKTVFRNVAASGSIHTQVDGGTSTITLMEIEA